jgi:hypothetical protein
MRRKARPRRERVIELRASVEDDLFSLAEEAGRAEARWNRPRKQLSAQGMGMNDPVADNNTAEGRQKSRRVEIIVSG